MKTYEQVLLTINDGKPISRGDRKGFVQIPFAARDCKYFKMANGCVAATQSTTPDIVWHPDGTVVINKPVPFYAAPNLGNFFAYALGATFCQRVVMSEPQLVISVGDRTWYKYFAGIIFNKDKQCINPRPLLRKHVDKEETEIVRAGFKEFSELFKQNFTPFVIPDEYYSSDRSTWLRHGKYPLLEINEPRSLRDALLDMMQWADLIDYLLKHGALQWQRAKRESTENGYKVIPDPKYTDPAAYLAIVRNKCTVHTTSVTDIYSHTPK